ncbi:MAG: NYN domain-containing protein [Anaerolineales bacterium]|nr:NYN domain-containing protein [Anaerolineales bacterium]
MTAVTSPYITPTTMAYNLKVGPTSADQLAIDPPHLSLKERLKFMIAEFDDNQLKMELSTLFQIPKIDIRLDFENLYIGLKRMGWTPEPDILSKAIKQAVKNLGEISKITAYADWGMLDSKNCPDIQRKLALNDIEPCYLINLRNKNSADMRIASDIRNLLERNSYGLNPVDIIVLGSGDRDFRPVVREARNRGKHVTILTLKNSLSRMLHDVASEVLYLDDYLDLPKLRRTQNK